MGAESEYYQNRNKRYEPRNGDLRSLAELELVAGVWPENLRGGDQRLLNQSTVGDTSNWGQYLTALTYSSGYTTEGLDKFVLDEAEPIEIAEYFQLSDEQAEAVSSFASDHTPGQLEGIFTLGVKGPQSSGGSLSSTGRSTSGIVSRNDESEGQLT